MAGALLFAGFRSAIATQWSIADCDGPPIADMIYAHIFSQKPPGTNCTAVALRAAVRKLRDEGVSIERWVPFIHMGV
jgi:CHAT domain-containing protein